MNRFYIRRFIRIAIILCFFIWVFVKIISKKPIMPISSVSGGFRRWYEQNIHIVDLILKTVLGIASAFSVFYFVLPFSLDIPDIISGNYQVVEGTVLTNAYLSRDSYRVVRVLDEKSGDEISVRVNYTSADKGDKIAIKYLKHSKEGIVVAHEKGN